MIKTILLALLVSIPGFCQVGSLRGRSELLGGGQLVCQVTTVSLTGGSQFSTYSQTLATAGCAAPVAWTITAGSLCTGLALNGSTGTIAGTPTIAQACSFTVQATDSTTATATQPYSITISAAGSIMGGRSLSGGASKR